MGKINILGNEFLKHHQIFFKNIGFVSIGTSDKILDIHPKFSLK
jgi:hypothetical protein